MATANDSNISKPTKGNEKAPIRAHKRLALGEKYNGQTNPNGGKGSTVSKIGNDRKTY